MTDLKNAESGTEEVGSVKNVIMAQECDVKLAGMWSTIVAILKTMIGAGILGLPYAFRSGGWLFSIFVFPVIALITGYCMVALIKAKEAAHLSRTTAPADVGEAGFGTAGRIIVGVVLCLDSVGVCLSYFIFITFNMSLLTGLRQEIWAVIFFFLFLLASYIRPVKLISYLTLIANVLTLVGVIVSLIAVFVAAKPIGEPHLFNWKEFPLFLGIVLFAFQAIEMALPAHNMLRNQRRFTPSVVIVLSIACVAYLLFGLIVYLRLGDNSLPMITEAIDVFGVQVAVAVLFIISLCANLICWIYPIYEIADRLSCANKYRIISSKERARILAENEGGAVEINPASSPSAQPATPNPPTPEGSPSISSLTVETDGATNVDSPPQAATPAHSASSSQGMPPPASASEPASASASASESASESSKPASSEAASASEPAVYTSQSHLAPVGSASTIEPLDGQAGAAADDATEEPEPGCFRSILQNWKFWVLSTIGRAVVLLIIMIPSVTPARDHFESFLGLSGCTTGMCMSFLLPMFAQLKIQWKTLPLWQKILDIFIIVVSVPAMVYITVITLIDLVDSLKG